MSRNAHQKKKAEMQRKAEPKKEFNDTVYAQEYSDISDTLKAHPAAGRKKNLMLIGWISCYEIPICQDCYHLISLSGDSPFQSTHRNSPQASYFDFESMDDTFIMSHHKTPVWGEYGGCRPCGNLLVIQEE